MRVIGYLDSTGSFTSLEIVSLSEYSSEETQIRGHILEIRQKKWYVLQSGTDKYRSYFFSPASDWIDDVDPDRCSYGLMPPVGITLGGFKESYQKERYSVLSSEPMTFYLSETASYTQSCSLDIQNALKTIKLHFKTEGADTAVSIPDARIKSYSVTSLPFGYREVTLRGDLAPGESVSLRALKVILDKEDNVVWPRPDDYYVYADNLDLNNDEVSDFWLSFDNIEDSFYRIMPVVNASAYYLNRYESSGSWGYQILRLSPGGFSVLHNRTDGT